MKPGSRAAGDAKQRDPYALETKSLRAAMATRTAETAGAFFLPYLKPGMRLLDAGCGGGSITFGLAAVVSPGEVVGVDVEASQVEAAAAEARERKLANLSFRTGSVYQLPFPDASFDAAFSHAVLEHLGEPVRGLTEIRRVLKPGGLVGVRSLDRRGWLIAPSTRALLEAMDALERTMDHIGGNRRIGAEIKRLLREAGLRVEATAGEYETHATPEAVGAWAETSATLFREGKLAEQMLRLGLGDRDKLESWAQEWLSWAKSPDAFLARTMVHGVGRKV